MLYFIRYWAAFGWVIFCFGPSFFLLGSNPLMNVSIDLKKGIDQSEAKFFILYEGANIQVHTINEIENMRNL